MLPPSTPLALDPAPTETVTLSVANCSPADAQFLRNVVAIFADPQYGRHLDKVRTGNSAIHYEASGALTVKPTAR